MKHETEYVHYNICGEDDTTLVYQLSLDDYYPGRYRTQDWAIVRCNQCNLTYLNPRLTQEQLQEFYNFDNEDDMKFVEDIFIDTADSQRPKWHRYLGVLQKHQPLLNSSELPLKLLDIGCGAGSFLVEARSLGYDVEGQEISPYFIEYSRTQHQLTTHDGFLDELSLEATSYDCITAFDVLEHHLDPTTFLSQIHKLLKPQGVIMMTTPDIGNWFAQRYGSKWRQIHPIGHVYYFDRKTVTHLLEKNGFRLLQIGGMHTIDASRCAITKRQITQFLRVILLRSMAMGIYKPITSCIPALTKWQLNLKGATLNHKKFLIRIGNQIIMDDAMVFVAQKI